MILGAYLIFTADTIIPTKLYAQLNPAVHQTKTKSHPNTNLNFQIQAQLQRPSGMASKHRTDI